MNDRIKEFEAQCWKQVPCDFDMREGGASTIRTVFDREKFAELIIRECAAMAYSYDPLEPVPSAIAKLIQTHFGVKE
jgi:hypothetical protein